VATLTYIKTCLSAEKVEAMSAVEGKTEG